tara:strand:- start:470 stop:721 length:252 start_codon:yes stop_codon:yes gene_type:complete
MYYLWRLLGYTEEELTYLSVAELNMLHEEREEAKQPIVKTRANGRKSLNTKYIDDVKELVKGKKIADIKERWVGVKGLDGEKH